MTIFAGQFRMTGSRILAQWGTAELRERLGSSFQAIWAGPGGDPDADMGPVIDRADVERVGAVVSDAAAYADIIVRRPGDRGTVRRHVMHPAPANRARQAHPA